MLGPNQRPLPCKGSEIVFWSFLVVAKLLQKRVFTSCRFPQAFRSFTRVAARLLHRLERSSSARLALSGDPITFASVTLQDRLVWLDTEAGTIGYADPVVLVVGAQATDILGQHDRSAHLHRRGVVEREGEVQAGCRCH